MWDSIAIAILLALSIVFFLFYRERVRKMSLLRSLDLPGPAPHWLYGNLKAFHGKLMFEVIRNWTKQYGKVFGYYEGTTPIIVTSDPDVVSQVFLRKFGNFTGRKLFPIQPDPDTSKGCISMFLARGLSWKRLRSIVNPAFSSGKLKMTSSLMNRKITVFVDLLRKNSTKTGTPVNIQPCLQALTLDVIGEAAFGLHIDAQNNEKDPFLVSSRSLFTKLERKTPLHKIGMMFPELRNVIWDLAAFLGSLFGDPRWLLTKLLRTVIKERRNEPGHKVDLLQLMLDAEADDSYMQNHELKAMTTDHEEKTNGHIMSPINGHSIANNNNNNDLKNNNNDNNNNNNNATELPNMGLITSAKIKRKLTNEEIQEQCLLVLLAGYESTSTAMTYCSYLLATNQDKQRLLAEEIDNILGPEEDPVYEKIQQMPYLHSVLCETLRMYPLASLVINRICEEECTVNGIQIPVGAVVHADVWSIHYDPDLWGPTDPNVFEPERFSEENRRTRHPMAWLAFGAGPRNCIGLRFALMEAKLTLARLVQHFTFEPCDLTQIPPTVKEAGVITPKQGVTVRLVPRERAPPEKT